MFFLLLSLCVYVSVCVCVCFLCILNVLIKNTNLYIKFVQFYCLVSQTRRVAISKTTLKLLSPLGKQSKIGQNFKFHFPYQIYINIFV